MMKRGPLFFALLLTVLAWECTDAFAKPKRERASEFLARLSSYRTWTQVNRFDGDVSSATYKIEDSAMFSGG